MATLNNVRRNYDKLTNQERLQLVANAVLRDDECELEALTNSTPKKTYSMSDAWMVERYDAIWRIGVVYWIATEELLREKEEWRHRYSVVELDSEYILSKEGADPKKIKREKALKLTELHIQEYDNLIWAVAEGLRKHAEHVGLAVDELLAHLPESVRGRAKWERHDYGDSHQDESNLTYLVEKYRSLFAGYWPS